MWLDTILVANRAYHASCHKEAARDRESTPVYPRTTPEPVLGKRKAEVSFFRVAPNQGFRDVKLTGVKQSELQSVRGRVKMDGV